MNAHPLRSVPPPVEEPELIIPDDVMALLIRSIEETYEPEEDEEEPPPPPPVAQHYAHPLSHPDFYCFFAAAATMLATTSSLIDQHMLEPLIFASIALSWLGLVFNLTRDRTHVTVVRRPITLNITLPKWVAGGRAPKTLREAQISAGIKPVDYES